MFRNVKCRSLILIVVLCGPDDWSQAFRILAHERQEVRKERRKCGASLFAPCNEYFHDDIKKE